MPGASEIELKLTITSGRLADVRRRLAGGNLQRAKIDDIYFDTPNRLLRQHGLVLRIRRDGDQWRQTLKAADRSTRVVSERGEWEAMLGSGKERPSPDLALLRRSPNGTVCSVAPCPSPPHSSSTSMNARPRSA